MGPAPCSGVISERVIRNRHQAPQNSVVQQCTRWGRDGGLCRWRASQGQLWHATPAFLQILRHSAQHRNSRRTLGTLKQGRQVRTAANPLIPLTAPLPSWPTDDQASGASHGKWKREPVPLTSTSCVLIDLPACPSHITFHTSHSFTLVHHMSDMHDTLHLCALGDTRSPHAQRARPRLHARLSHPLTLLLTLLSMAHRPVVSDQVSRGVLLRVRCKRHVRWIHLEQRNGHLLPQDDSGAIHGNKLTQLCLRTHASTPRPTAVRRPTRLCPDISLALARACALSLSFSHHLQPPNLSQARHGPSINCLSGCAGHLQLA
jgi:hypothetical protein